MADMEISEEVIDFFQNLSNDEPAPTEGEPATETTEEVEPTEETGEVAENESETTETVDEEPVAETTEETETVEEEVNWEERYKNLQSQKDREVAQTQEQLTQLQQWAQQQYAWQQQVIAEQQAQQLAAQQAATQHVAPEQIESAIENDPVGTFQWVAFNRPDLMPQVIATVRGKEKLGHAVADSMMTEFTQFQIQRSQQQTQQAHQEFLDQQAAQNAPAEVENTMVQILSALEERHGEPFKALNEDIAVKASEAFPGFRQYMDQNGMQITPQAVADFVTQVYLDVREEKLNGTSMQPRKAEKLTPQQHVENPGANRRVESTPDEIAMNELLQGARALGIDVTETASA